MLTLTDTFDTSVSSKHAWFVYITLAKAEAKLLFLQFLIYRSTLHAVTSNRLKFRLYWPAVVVTRLKNVTRSSYLNYELEQRRGHRAGAVGVGV